MAEVRIFALNKKNFPNIAEVRKYFLEDLPNKGYSFDLLGMRFVCGNDTLIYFQYSGYIVVSAVANAPSHGMLPIQEGSIRIFTDQRIPTRDLGGYGVRAINGRPLNEPVKQGAPRIDPQSIPGLERVIRGLLGEGSRTQVETMQEGVMQSDAQALIKRISEIEKEITQTNSDDVFVEIGPHITDHSGFPQRNLYPSNRKGPCCPMAEFVALRVMFSRFKRPWGSNRILKYIIECLSEHIEKCPKTKRIMIVTEFWNDKECVYLRELVRSISHRDPGIIIEGYLRIDHQGIRIF